MPPKPESTPEERTSLLMTMVDQLADLAHSAAGYRQRCQDAGFSAEAAEQMAVDMHSHLIRKAFEG